MILEWFKKSPLELKEDFFHIAKTEFLGFTKLKNEFLDCLSENYLNIFNLFLSSKYYLDFIAEYKLSLVEYSSVIDSVKKDYKISVIIPIFNTGDIIHRTFMSIINQTIGYEDIEVIMVDDCSTDKTSEIIDEYAHKYDGFKAIHLKNNTGSPGTPRNVGIKEASADYIMFLDHDDFFEINAFETLYDEILKADQDLVFGNYNSITNGKLNNISFPNEKWGYFKDIGENERFVASPPPSIWTKLFKKELIIKNNILFPTILGEDAIFLSKVLLNAKGISYLGDSLICYHDLRDTSFTNNVSLRYLTEGFVSEKYLFNLYKSINKEHYFKYRCEGNINFFLNQFIKSNLDKEEIKTIFPLLNWFVNIGNSYELKPVELYNRFLFNFILQKDIESITEFKKILVSNNYSLTNKNSMYLRKDLVNLINNFSEDLKLLNKEVIKELDKANDSIKEKNKIIKEKENEIKELKSFKGWIKQKMN